jgi:hypothetical protein
MMSCTEGTGHEQFLTEVSKLTSNLMGKEFHLLTYDYSEHNKRSRWL